MPVLIPTRMVLTGANESSEVLCSELYSELPVELVEGNLDSSLAPMPLVPTLDKERLGVYDSGMALRHTTLRSRLELSDISPHPHIR